MVEIARSVPDDEPIRFYLISKSSEKNEALRGCREEPVRISTLEYLHKLIKISDERQIISI